MSVFWGVVKNKVYERNPYTVNELKDYISEEFTDIFRDRNLCHSVCQCFLTDMKIVARLKMKILRD